MHILVRAATVAATVLAAISSLLGGALIAASPSDAATNGTMVTFGDSVASGGRCSCTPFPRRYASKVSARTGRHVRMTNYAFGGATSTGILKQLHITQVRSTVRSSNTALVMIGANDFVGAFNRVLQRRQGADAAYRPVAGRVQTNVTTFIRTLRRLRPGIKVVVAGYWNVVKDGDVGRNAYGAWGMSKAVQATWYANSALRNAAAATGATYLSTYHAFKGVSGKANPTWLLASDGDHPNAQGHAVIATAFFKAAPNG